LVVGFVSDAIFELIPDTWRPFVKVIVGAIGTMITLTKFATLIASVRFNCSPTLDIPCLTYYLKKIVVFRFASGGATLPILISAIIDSLVGAVAAWFGAWLSGEFRKFLEFVNSLNSPLWVGVLFAKSSLLNSRSVLGVDDDTDETFQLKLLFLKVNAPKLNINVPKSNGKERGQFRTPCLVNIVLFKDFKHFKYFPGNATVAWPPRCRSGGPNLKNLQA